MPETEEARLRREIEEKEFEILNLKKERGKILNNLTPTYLSEVKKLGTEKEKEFQNLNLEIAKLREQRNNELRELRQKKHSVKLKYYEKIREVKLQRRKLLMDNEQLKKNKEVIRIKQDEVERLRRQYTIYQRND